ALSARPLSLRTLVAFAIVANSHHPGQFEKHWQILAGIGCGDWPLKERIISMGHDRDSGDNISTRLTFFLVGAGIGAVLALLFAPKSGEELRNDIADATRKGIDKSKEAAQQLGTKAGEYYDTGRAKAGELYDTARETAGEYYEATRERATELYDTASTKAGEVVARTKDTVSAQAGSLAAAV